MRKTVTVSIPTYNGEKFILEALESVLNQSRKVDKIIVCDNCSTDKTIELVNEFSINNSSFDIEVFVNSENLGFQNNFIKCYDKSATDFMVMLHVDDLLKPFAIEKQLAFFEKNPNFAIVGGKGDIINGEGTFIVNRERTEDLLFDRNELYEFIKATSSYIPCSTVMYNLKLVRSIPFIEEKSLGPDELYWPKLLKVHPIAVLGISLIDNRIYEGQMHNANAVSKSTEYIEHLNKKIEKADLETSPDKIKMTRKIIKRQVAHMSLILGQDTFKYYKNSRIAFRYFQYALKQHPKVIFKKYFFRAIAKMLNFI